MFKYGVSFLPDAEPETKSPVTYYQEAITLSKMADAAGFHYIKMTEHYLHGYGGYCPNPLTFLASVATCTEHIRLMTGCLLPVFHHPVALASEICLVDAISQGRLDVGFARAYLPYEFATFGIDMNESRERYMDSIVTMIKLMTEQSVTINTAAFGLEQATIFPRPTQQPHPPIWGAAVRSRESFAWLGEQGFNLMVTPPLSGLVELKAMIDIYREAYADAGWSKPCEIALSLPILIDEQEQSAKQYATKYLNEYLRVWSSAVSIWSGTKSLDYTEYEKMAAFIGRLTPAEMMKNSAAIA
ncbi:MAG: LLM class flavin-dependent oxidoreductase, partial [Coxiellaceae bacterium]|nr:LLM class flavin-dependent oxidoreductase [Coxiellaceae bacterium]